MPIPISREDLTSRIIDFKQANTKTLTQFAAQRLHEALNLIYNETSDQEQEVAEKNPELTEG